MILQWSLARGAMETTHWIAAKYHLVRCPIAFFIGVYCKVTADFILKTLYNFVNMRQGHVIFTINLIITPTKKYFKRILPLEQTVEYHSSLVITRARILML